MSHPDDEDARQPEYPMALEPPDPVAPTIASRWVPAQAAGVHDAAPASASPAPSGPMPEPAGRRRPGLRAALAAVMALVVLAGGVLGFLWWDTERELTETRERLSEEIDTVARQSANQSQEIDRLADEVERARGDLANAEEELAGRRHRVAQLEDEQGPLHRCVARYADVAEAVDADDTSALEEAIEAADEACEEASDLLADG